MFQIIWFVCIILKAEAIRCIVAAVLAELSAKAATTSFRRSVYTRKQPMFQQHNRWKCKNRSLVITNNAFKVILPNRNTQKAVISESVTPEERIIAYINEHGSITRPEAQSLLQ